MPEFSTRTPLSTYEQAIWRLAQWEASERYAPDQMELAVQVVSDVFWLSDAKVRFDMKKAVRSLAAMPAARPPRAARVERVAAW